MQASRLWTAAANLDLLLNSTHPPARIDKGALALKDEAGGRNYSAGQGLRPLVDARSAVDFFSTSYCGVQDPQAAPRAYRALVRYYQHLFSRIALWGGRGFESADDGGCAVEQSFAEGSGGSVGTPSDGTAVPVDVGFAAGQGADHLPARADGRGAASLYRALGILTQVHDMVGEQALLPWEFFAIQDIDDEASYAAAFQALKKDVAQGCFSLLFAGTTHTAAGEGADVLVKQRAPNPLQDDSAEGGGAYMSHGGPRLSLFARLLPAFTGVYPGMAVGIVGEPFQRDARGVLTGVLLRDLVLPHRPLLPWRVDRPLPLAEGGKTAIPTRVHFCSGPFPRRDIRGLLQAATHQALHRGADALLIGGPLIKPFEEFEREILPSLGATFAEMLDTFADAVEEVVNAYYATRPNYPRLKVIFISHRDDVTQIPVLPTTRYALSDTEDILFRSNPARIAVNGVHFSVCNEDVVGIMRDAMVERWPREEGSLYRVVETLVQSRWFTPVMGLPTTCVDMSHLHKLRLDYAPPEECETSRERDPSAGHGDRAACDAQQRDAAFAEDHWRMVLCLDGIAEVPEPEPELKRLKREEAAEKEEGGGVSCPARALEGGGVEFMPHVVFLPSTRPEFAVVTHRGVVDPTTRAVKDESPLDKTAAATGVLAVNQRIWSRRASPRFELRVAEVTISDSELVVLRGASAANGVTCGVLHIFCAQEA